MEHYVLHVWSRIAINLFNVGIHQARLCLVFVTAINIAEPGPGIDPGARRVAVSRRGLKRLPPRRVASVNKPETKKHGRGSELDAACEREELAEHGVVHAT
ncbi:hypothetical protein CBL_04638 [Carabus blaptoides fortunei]